MNSVSTNLNKWIWLTIPISILVFIAAGLGWVVDGIYSSSSNFVTGITKGADLVTFVIAFPGLIISAILTRRGSQRARLIWLGILVYLTYNYLMTAFMVDFNSLFLIYLALLGLSAFTLLGGLATTDLIEFKDRFSEDTPVKIVSLFLGAVVIVFYPVWLLEIIPAQISGELPRMIKWAQTPTHAYYVLDLALLFPALAFTARWLWHRRAIGYLFAGAALVFLSIEIVTIISGMLFVAQRSDLYPIFPEIIIYIIGSLFTLSMLIWYLRGMKE